MNFQKNYFEIDLSSNSTFDIDVEADYNIIYAFGTATGNVTIGVDGASAPVKGMKVELVYNGTMGANTLTVLGTNVPVASDNVKGLFTFYYNGSAWLPLFNPSTDTAYLNNSQVKSDAAIVFSKLATLTASRIPQINASGVIEPSATNNSFLALLGALTEAAADYNKVAAFTGTTANLNRVAGGSWTAAELQFLAGVTSNLQTQLNAKANTADFSGILEIRSFEVTIPAASVLAMNATPITLVTAVASKKIVPFGMTGQINFGGTPYTDNGNLVITSGGAISAVAANDFIFSTVSRTVNINTDEASGVTQAQYIAGQPLQATIASGEALNGDSTIILRGLYYLID